MDKILTNTLLADYYGKLLTDKQKDMFKMRYEEDMSLSEISEIFNISRQAVSEKINIAEKTMLEYEEKLGLIKKQAKINEVVDKLNLIINQNKLSNELKEEIEIIKKDLERL